MTPTARTTSAISLMTKKVIYLDGQLFFNYNLLEDIREESKSPDIEEGALSVDQRAAAGSVMTTPAPRGRFSWFRINRKDKTLLLHTIRGDYPLPLDTKLQQLDFTDVFWTGRTPYPVESQRLGTYRALTPGVSVHTFARQFERGAINYALLDNRVVQWVSNPPKQPITIGFFNYDDDLDLPRSREFKHPKELDRFMKGGKMLHFDEADDELIHWADLVLQRQLAMGGMRRAELW